MAKKKQTYSGGAADRKRRGLKGILVGVTPELHARILKVTGARLDDGRKVTRWAAAALEAAVTAEENGQPVQVPPVQGKGKSEESSG